MFFSDGRACLSAIQAELDQYFRKCPQAAILEAGCGSLSRLVLPEDAVVTGIDISAEQLRKNIDLVERIEGDVCTYRFPFPRFDLVICWDVLEHVTDPASALVNLVSAVKPGGWVILKFPNLLSLKGLVTKFTPFAFHRWYYLKFASSKRMRGVHITPFPVFFRWAIAPPAIQKQVSMLDADIVREIYYRSNVVSDLLSRIPFSGALLEGAHWLARLLSVGRFLMLDSEVLFVIRRAEVAGESSCPE